MGELAPDKQCNLDVRTFADQSLFNQDIGNWDVSNVKDMSGMFYGASNYNSPMKDWDVGNLVNMESMFFNAQNLIKI